MSGGRSVADVAREIAAEERRLKRLRKLVQAHEPEGEYPTIAELARRLRMRQQDLADLVDGAEGFDLLVGVRIGGGIYSFRTVGEYQVEYYGDDDEN